ncbi:transglycosylase family protein [Cryptosporangium aurantiacum]|uniref:transglycosylase family protein n=1 Tax=Cryptosporangium aurantiacum TaxID=134849 RepID=UPI002481B5B3|nr:transglycosylase family protein [Cryptosporangium aurantiacum]
MAGASPAHADVNWDAIAQCESGGRWNINTGNGYQGGLQFSPSTWRSHGGGKYAAGAHNASRSEQITVARRVLRSQGIGAWPTCGRKGYTKKRYRSSWSDQASRSYKRQGYTKKYSKRSWEKSTNEYTGYRSHRSTKSWRGGSTENRSYRGQDVRKRTTNAAPRRSVTALSRPTELRDFVPKRPFDVTARQTTATPRFPSYLVRPGDSLVLIAVGHRVSWQSLYAKNRRVIGANPNVIHPGQRILIG